MKHNENEFEYLLEQEQETREAMLNMLEDLQEQKDMIEHSHREWIDAFDAIDDAVMLHDKDNNIMRVNNSYKKLSSIERYEDIIGEPYFKVFPKLSAPMHTCRESVETGKVAQEEFLLDDGRIFRSRTYPIYDENSEYSYGIHIFEDITQERLQEERIKELNKTLKLISRCNEVLVRSQSEEELIGKVSEEIIGQNEYDLIGFFLIDNDAINWIHHELKSGELPKITSIDFADAHYKECPVRVCIEEKRVININDIENDPTWAEVLKRFAEISPATFFGMKGSMLFLPLHNHETLGAMSIYSQKRNFFNDEKTDLFIELSNDTAYGIHTLRLRQKFLQTSQERDGIFVKLKDSLSGTVESIGKMVEARDPYTSGHQKRVAELAVKIAEEMNLEDKTIEGIKLAALIHDIGKIQLPSEILTKPTKLTELEYEMIKTHPSTGYEILKNIHFPWPIAEIVYQHHEKIDGSGYPRGLKGEEILLEARIITVADVMEAISSHRPYRASLGVEFALEVLENSKGREFDAQVVEACLNLFKDKNFKF